eukprot:jgi/Bigna1/134105/aug1.23_g8813
METLARRDSAETTTPVNMKAQDTTNVRLPLQINQVVFRLQPLTILSFMQDLNRTNYTDRTTNLKSKKVLSSFIHDSQNAIVGWSAARLLHVKQPFEIKTESIPLLTDRLEHNVDFAKRSRKRKIALTSSPSETILGNKSKQTKRENL